jgi:class 3 adenylate cyclase/streptogramin lyase
VEEGVVTIMFTDVEGSTDVTRRLGDEEGRRVIEAYKRLVREELGRQGGREVDSIGDGFFVTFASTRRAVSCAVEIQKALDRHGHEQSEEQIRVRIGLNVGEVIERDGHPFGAAVNATERVASRAKGGQIFVSEPVRHLAGTIPGVSFRGRGRHEVKGFPERWRLYEVVWERPTRLAPRPAPKPEAKPRWKLRALGVGGIALAAIVAGVLALLLSGGRSHLSRVDANTVGILDPKNGTILGQVRVGARPIALAYGEGALWVANAGDRTVSRVDPASREQVHAIGVGGFPPSGIAAGESSVWVPSGFADEVALIDPRTDTVDHTISLPDGSGPAAVAIGGGFVWVANAIGNTVSRISPQTDEVKSTTPVRGEPKAIAFGEHGVWVANTLSKSVSRLSPSTGSAVAPPIALRFPPAAIAAGEGAVWVVSTEGDNITKIDPKTNAAVGTITVGNAPVAVAAGEGGVWVANSLDHSVWRIDPGSNRIEQKIAFGSSPDAIVVADGRVWVTAHAP